MPRVSRAETERNRELIDHCAAALLRARGLGVGVADVMSAAGLTTGSFYKNFSSKDEMVARACQLAFDEVAERWRKRVESTHSSSDALSLIALSYLSETNCAEPSKGCPLAALASEVARESAEKPIRDSFSNGFRQLLSIIAALQPEADPAAKRESALVSLSLMVGSMVLARATRGDPVSDELLQTARSRFSARASAQAK